MYVCHLVVQRTGEIYRTGCSDIVAVWGSEISYSQLVKPPNFSKLHCWISQIMTLRNLVTLSILSPKLLLCAGTLSHVHIIRGFPTVLVKNTNNSNKMVCVKICHCWAQDLLHRSLWQCWVCLAPPFLNFCLWLWHTALLKGSHTRASLKNLTRLRKYKEGKKELQKG